MCPPIAVRSFTVIADMLAEGDLHGPITETRLEVDASLLHAVLVCFLHHVHACNKLSNDLFYHSFHSFYLALASILLRRDYDHTYHTRRCAN